MENGREIASFTGNRCPKNMGPAVPDPVIVQMMIRGKVSLSSPVFSA